MRYTDEDVSKIYTFNPRESFYKKILYCLFLLKSIYNAFSNIYPLISCSTGIIRYRCTGKFRNNEKNNVQMELVRENSKDWPKKQRLTRKFRFLSRRSCSPCVTFWNRQAINMGNTRRLFLRSAVRSVTVLMRRLGRTFEKQSSK